MARPPFPAERARRLLLAWVEERVPKAATDAPLTMEAAVEFLRDHKLPSHRATLTKYKLNELIADGAARQLEDASGSRRGAEQAAYEQGLAELREKIQVVETRNRELLGQLAVVTWNARRLSITHEDLFRATPKPNRTESRAGRRRT